MTTTMTAESRYTIERNNDGSAIVKLRDPVVFDTGRGADTIGRLTIPRVTGRHMRAATWPLGQSPTLGQTLAWANAIVEPVGIVDELDAQLARDIATEVALMLVGKRPKTGAEPSPT
jgi:hypothetical protein